MVSYLWKFGLKLPSTHYVSVIYVQFFFTIFILNFIFFFFIIIIFYFIFINSELCEDQIMQYIKNKRKEQLST